MVHLQVLLLEHVVVVEYHWELLVEPVVVEVEEDLLRLLRHRCLA